MLLAMIGITGLQPMMAQRMVQASKHIRAYETEKGFELIALVGETPLLVGYSDESTFDEACENPTFRRMLQQMETKAKRGAQRGLEGLPRRRSPMARIPASFGPIFKPADVDEAVRPLCTDVWHQYTSPYYDLCPTIEGKPCVAGCVATSQAQVMRYHRWPEVGTGSYSYFDEEGCKQEVAADFSSHRYDWDHMLDAYSNGYDEQEGLAVAQLMSDCGISVNMRYGTDTSGARVVRQPQALVNYFGYDTGIMMRYRNFYRQVEWDSIMFHEINERRPMLVGGWTTGLAHSFVCDGYDENGYFHINFGNVAGQGNGFYYFNFLTPDVEEWHQHGDNPEDGFNMLQCITTGIQPLLPGQQAAPQHWVYAFSHWEQLYPQNDPLCLVVHNLCNIGWNRHEGQVAIALKPERMGNAAVSNLEEGCLLYTYDREFLLEEVDDTTYTDTLQLSIPQHVKDGTYRIVPVFEDQGQWVEARTMVGIPNYLRCTVSGQQVSVVPPSEELFDLKVTDVSDFPTLFVHWTRPDYTIHLRNDGCEYSGRFYVALYSDAQPEQNVIIAQEGISIQPGETAVRPFTEMVFGKVPVGIYHLRIMVDVDLFSDSLVTIYDDPQTDIEVVATLPTGIEEVKSEKLNVKAVEAYDLQGRRLDAVDARRRRQVVIERYRGSARKVLR